MPREVSKTCPHCKERVRLQTRPSPTAPSVTCAARIVFADHATTLNGQTCPGSGTDPYRPGTPEPVPAHKTKKRGVEALLASTAFPFHIDPFDGGRVKITLEALQIDLSPVQARSVATGLSAVAKFGPDRDAEQVFVTISRNASIGVPRGSVAEMQRRLRQAAEIAEQYQPD